MITDIQLFADLIADGKALADLDGTEGALVARAREAAAGTKALQRELDALNTRKGEIVAGLMRNAQRERAIVEVLFDLHGSKFTEAIAAARAGATSTEPPPGPPRAERVAANKAKVKAKEAKPPKLAG